MKRFHLIFSLVISIFLSSCERPTENNQDDDGIPPAVPAGLRFYSATDGEIIIEWIRNSERDLHGYNIYRSINGSAFQKIFFTQNDFYFDDSLNYDDEYSYRITAVDFAERESSSTEIISAKPINRYAPAVPRYLTINARNWEERKSIYIQWEAVEASDVAGYSVYRSDSPSFTADSSNLIGVSNSVFFDDTTDLQLYKKYYYRIKAVDKGGLQSIQSAEINDLIFEIPGIIFPLNNISTKFFSEFLINTLEVPAVYKIIVQTNEFFGEFWSTEIYSSVVNVTLPIPFNPPYLEADKKYYWRVAAYSSGSEPNSISKLYNFTVKQ